MADSKSTTPWAVASLACGILGWLGALSVLAIVFGLVPKTDTTGVSEGLAVVAYGFLSLVLCLSGVICGTVALRKIRRGPCGGRGKAWTGITLGCMPLALLLAWGGTLLWEELSIRDPSKFIYHSPPTAGPSWELLKVGVAPRFYTLTVAGIGHAGLYRDCATLVLIVNWECKG